MSSRLLFPAAIGVLSALLLAGLVLAVNEIVDGARSMAPDDEPSASAAEADVLAAEDGYAVWGRQVDGTPVRWNPCEPIRWRLDARDAPDGIDEVIRLAMARITAATGIEFSYEGPVLGDAPTDLPSLDRPLTVETIDGLQWAPVLLTWVPGGSTDLPLGDNERGVTVPVAVRDEGPKVFVTGQVAFNSDKRLLPAFEDRHASWGAVILHELAHLVGLDHVDDPTQLLHPTPGFGPVVLGDGDLAGLAAVGADGGCVPVPAPQELTVSYG